MTDVRINGAATPVRVKAVEPAVAPHAKQLLEGRKDGYDTYGVNADGRDQLILTRSKKPLTTSDPVSVDGKPATVTFVENEANTFGERFAAPFKSKGGKIAIGVGSLAAMGIATPFGLALGVTPVGWVLGLALWAAVGAGVVSGVMAAGSLVNAGLKNGAQADEAVTDGLAKK